MPLPFIASTNTQSMPARTVEISLRGKWIRVPAFVISGATVVVKGRWIKVASFENEDYVETELSDPEVYVRDLKQRSAQGSGIDIFTFSQQLPNITPRHSYQMEWDSIAAVCTTNYKDWWNKLPQETRKNVRRSQKRGVVVTVRSLDDDLIRGIVGVNNDSPVRQNIAFVHHGKTFDQVKRDQLPFLDRSDFVCAYAGDELIGFIKMAYRGDIASIVQILPKASHNDKRPANALIAKAIEICESKGILYLTYGQFSYGNKHESSLVEFKVRNGFEEVLVPRFYVPLTSWGGLCTKLKVHRGLIGILPNSVIKVGIGLRGKCKDLMQWIHRCSSVSERSNRDREVERSNPPAGSSVLPVESVSALPHPSQSELGSSILK